MGEQAALLRLRPGNALVFKGSLTQLLLFSVFGVFPWMKGLRLYQGVVYVFLGCWGNLLAGSGALASKS